MLASSFIAIIWFLCGAIAVLSMLFMLGGKHEASSLSPLKWTHRISGAVFTILYLLYAIIMIPKYQGNAPFLSTTITVHAYLGAALFPLLFIKHFIVRGAKRYYPALPYLGMTIITMAFLVVSFTGINHVILWYKGPVVTVQSSKGPRNVSKAIGRNLLTGKCARCHNLSILYKGVKDEDLWRSTIERMKNYDKALIITDDQVDHIVGYLLSDSQGM